MHVRLRVRRTSLRQYSMLVGVVQSFVYLALLLPFELEGRCDGQDFDGSRNKVADRRNVSQKAMKSLREGRPDGALQDLEPVASEATSISLSEDESLGAVCAGLNRVLSQLNYGEQYELLHQWSFARHENSAVRNLTALVPMDGPPPEFARALGERPRPESFPIPSIGQVRGIYSTGWSLVVSARETGKLKQMMAELRSLTNQKVAGAELLLLLGKIADDREDIAPVADQLAKRTSEMNAVMGAQDASSIKVESADLILAVAALNRPSLIPAGEELLRAILSSLKSQSAPQWRSFLRQTLAVASLMPRAEAKGSDVTALVTSRLKYWIPVSTSDRRIRSAAATWLAHEDHLLHLAGAANDRLMLRYPVTGDFQFQCENQLGGQFETDGGLAYGGLNFQAVGSLGDFRVTDSNLNVLEKRDCPFAHVRGRPHFMRMSLTSTPAEITVAVNGHPMWIESPVPSSGPWLGLTSDGDSRPLFRNLKLTGQPVIPRTVRLSDSASLRGWQTEVFGNRSTSEVEGDSGWHVSEGVLRVSGYVNGVGQTDDVDRGVDQKSRRDGSPVLPLGQSDDARRGVKQSLLSYERPLLNGETIKYEFFYELGMTEVSPAIGRLAFLLQPDGVRIRWLTHGDQEWTGLPDDNTVVEPLNRRGPRRLPLKDNLWNQITVSLNNQLLTLTLNDIPIYQRNVDWDGDHRFGLYCSEATTGAQVREIELTGDWPRELPQEFLNNPTATIGEPLALADRHAFERIFGGDVLATNVFAVRRRALAMPLAQRFEFLSEWVLPGRLHPGIRMTGDFTATRPAPPAQEPNVDHPELGAQVVSPVFDWLDVAGQLGRVTECRDRIIAMPVGDDEWQQRARTALLILLSMQDDTILPNRDEWDAFIGQCRKENSLEVENHWPEMLVAVRGRKKSLEFPLYQELITDLVLHRMLRWQGPDLARWQNHLGLQYGRVQDRRASVENPEIVSSNEFREWIPVTAARAGTMGKGHPNLEWSRRDTTTVKTSGHDSDFLFYRLPLSGNYDVECEIIRPGQAPLELLTAGTYAGLHWDLKGTFVGTFASGGTIVPFEPALTNVEKPVRYRATIRNGTRTIYFNGRSISTELLSVPVDPWVAIRSWSRYRSSLRDLRITGTPKVLNEVDLADSSELTGWLGYHDEGRWTHVEQPDSSGYILGHRNASFEKMRVESLLRYQRPLVEDGSIDYEFFYEPGDVESHPALDRLALIIHPAGIREHWITDGRHDLTDMSPDNITDVPENRRGPSEPPLVAHEWNRLRLTLQGSNLSVLLNEMLIYERRLEATNQRTFGLFHYADAVEARVRNVILKSEWPKTLPPVSAQELADHSLEWLDDDRPRLKSVFTHRFGEEGTSEKYFEMTNPTTIRSTKKGIEVNQIANGTHVYTGIVPRFSVSGDFDVEASFTGLEVESRKHDSGILFGATFDDPFRSIYDLSRILTLNGLQLSNASKSMSFPGGGSSWVAVGNGCETDSGRMRLSRRAAKLYFLFAEGDSPIFHLFSTEDVPDANVVRHGIRLQAFGLSGKTNVIWKEVSLRAEKLIWYPDASKASPLLLKIVQSDGSNLRTIATPASAGFTHLGSPEWSADGRQIAMDMSNGDTSSSHIVIVDSAGKGQRDLGPGCMPSFSGDGSRIAFSQPGMGIMTMKSDGTDRKQIDRAGWGTQWSPDGKWIAYAKSGNITLLDVATNKSKPILAGESASRYGYDYWNLGWSHDSRSIAFKGRLRETNGDEVAIVDIKSPGELEVLQAEATTTIADFTFSADNKQVLAVIDLGSDRGLKLHGISRKQPADPVLFSLTPKGQNIFCASASHDGKSVAMVVQEVPQPTEWINEMKAGTSQE